MTAAAPHLLLDPGMDLTLRPMRYPHFYDRFRDAIRNTWTVEEVDLHCDLADLGRMSAAERHLVFLCGHYEGIDERVHQHMVTDEVSIGDYVLTGGELPALVMTDSHLAR